MSEILANTWLLLVLLNPFLLIVYLIKLVDSCDARAFGRILMIAGAISLIVFFAFALLGELIFSIVFQAHFASFQIFGGIIFLIIGLQFIFKGPESLEFLRPDSKEVASSVAMPILIGPGTVSASVLIGKRLPPSEAILSIFTAVALSIVVMIVLKYFFDISRRKTETILQRYTEIAGRIIGLYSGTVAIEMLATGISTWIHELSSTPPV